MKSGRNYDLALLLLRLAFGGLMMGLWGKSKFLKLLTENPVQFLDPFGLGDQLTLGLCVFAEVFCAALIALGLYTRLACIPLIFNMIIAITYGEAGKPFVEREHAITYLVPYVVIFLMGPGWYSLDAQIRKTLD